MTERNIYGADFKCGIVELVIEGRRTHAEVSLDYDNPGVSVAARLKMLHGKRES